MSLSALLIFKLIFIETTLTQLHTENCEQVDGVLNKEVIWPATSDRTNSHPFCVDTSRQLIGRRCLGHGQWGPEPLCHYTQAAVVSNCPSDFIDNANMEMCYHITAKAKFQPACPFNDEMTFDSIDNYKRKLAGIEHPPLWLPVRRNFLAGIGFLEVIEPSFSYRTTVSADSYQQDKVLGMDCLVYYNSSYVEAVSCNEEHSRFCAYNRLHLRSNQSCSFDAEFCKISDFSPDSKCFCSGHNAGATSDMDKYPRAEFLKLYQNSVYLSLTSEDCLMGLEKVGKEYIWTNSKQPINYTNWKEDVTYPDDDAFGVITLTGWTLRQNKDDIKCIIYEKEAQRSPPPQLNLDYDDGKQKFVVTIANREGLKVMGDSRRLLLFCFTNAGQFELVHRYNTLVDWGDTFQFDALLDGPGEYWCESFLYPEMRAIASNRYFYRSRASLYEFVAIVRFRYPNGSNPLSPTITNFIQTVLFWNLEQNEYLARNYNCRIMKIIAVDEINEKMELNFHVSTKHSYGFSFALDGKKEWQKLHEIIDGIFSGMSDVALMDFKSADFCFEEQTSIDGITLNWPTTAINNNTQVYSKEYCFINGTRVARGCNGSFVDGASWDSVSSCDFLPESGVTKLLWDLFSNRSVSATTKLEILKDTCTSNYVKFKAVDLYIIGEILKQFEENQVIIVDLLETINAIVKIDGDIIAQSKKVTLSTDEILIQFRSILLQSLKNITQMATTDSISMFPLRSDADCVTIFGNNRADVISCANLTDERIDINSSLRIGANLGNGKALAITFSNGALFVDTSKHYKIISPLFNVVYQQLSKKFAFQMRTTYNTLSDSSKTYSCNSWAFTCNKNGYWMNSGEIHVYDTYITCDFRHPGTVALAEVVNSAASNVTEDLNTLYNSSEPVDDIIVKLVKISNKYVEFQEDDTVLAGKILEKISDATDVNLHNLAKIVSNLHEIRRKVLVSSQISEQTTDMILYNVDKLIRGKQSNEEAIVVTTNFMVLVGDLHKISGAMVLNNSNHLELQTIKLNESFNLNAQKNVVSAVVISSNLVRQMKNDTKLVITFYTSDALFNQVTGKQYSTSKILGVMLPALPQPYSDPVHVYHNVTDPRFDDECAHWSYEMQNAKGLWRNDLDREYVGRLVLCEYYHTTHFALLLLESDVDLILLDLITAVNCLLSAFGLVSIIATAVLFKKWRSNTGNQILLHFVFAMSLQIATFYVSNVINSLKTNALLCSMVGIVLHYSLISQFCWMFIIAILQFKRFVEVLAAPPKYILVKACFCGWILPLLPVSCVYVFDNDNYNESKVGLCYPSGLGLYLGVWLPIAIIVAINSVIFCYIIYNVLHKKTECVSNDSSDILVQWRLAVLLFFMLGLTWSFGFLCQLDFGGVFIYLFCIGATLQGFVMFLFFIVFNKNTRALYVYAIKSSCQKFQ